jgi:putative endonuclease
MRSPVFRAVVRTWRRLCVRFCRRPVVDRLAAGPAPGEPLGAWGERLAAEFLRRRGDRLLHRSYRSRIGEIDLVTLRRGRLVFVEVKTWQSARLGEPAEAVTLDKQRRLTRTALGYLRRYRLLEQPCQFDVIAIRHQAGQPPKITHIEHAFEAAGRFQLFS